MNTIMIVSLQEVTCSLSIGILFRKTGRFPRIQVKVETRMLNQPAERKNFDYKLKQLVFGFCKLLFSRRTDVNLAFHTARLELIGNCDVMTKQTVSWHLSAYHSGQYCACMNANTHLKMFT